jgi:hypothetical protein
MRVSSVGSYEFFVCLGARTPGLSLGCWFFIHDALLIEREQAFQDLFVGKIDRKPVSGGDGGIEFCVGIGEPSGALVIEIGQRALGQLFRALIIARFEAGITGCADAARVWIDNET